MRLQLRFSPGLKLPGAWRLLAVSWIWNESSVGFFHIHDSYWHQRQLCKSPAPKSCLAIPQGCSFIINYNHYLYRTGEFYIKAGTQLEHKAVQGAAHRQRNTRDRSSGLCTSPAPQPTAEVEKGGGKRYGQEVEGEADLSITFYALTSFLWLQGSSWGTERVTHSEILGLEGYITFYMHYCIYPISQSWSIL